MNTSLSTLASSLGGVSALQNKRAVCHGRDNITDANGGTELYNKMSLCDSNIKSACNIAIANDTMAQLTQCQNTMKNFE